MHVNLFIINKIVDNIMAMKFFLGYRIRERLVLIRTPIVNNPTVMMDVSFPLGMYII